MVMFTSFSFVAVALLAVSVISQDRFLQKERVRAIYCDHVKQTVIANSKFAFAMYQQIKNDNIVYSPISISSALAITHEGALGVTKTEMKDATSWLSMPAGCIVKIGFKGIISSLTSPNAAYHVDFVNKVYTDNSYVLESSFQLTTTNYYYSSSVNLDFQTNTANSLQTINNFVQAHTTPSIVNFLPFLDPNTPIVIVNAVTFVGKWLFPFATGATAPSNFQLSTGQIINTPTMKYSCGSKKLRHVYFTGGQMLELPYKGNGHDMYIIMPDNYNGINLIENDFDLPHFTSALGQLTYKNVNVQLPKFTTTSTFDNLSMKLMNLNMQKAFIPTQADFSGISSTFGIYIDAVVHKAIIAVNEEGTEASAVTAVLTCPSRRRRSNPIDFFANKPFLYVIRERNTGTIMFMGALKTPEIATIKPCRDCVDKRERVGLPIRG